ncbi:hypothetical protein [Bradyrhizobium sp. AUGA SZCCT0160]|uniref:hypothetical protein n=1 Tax=Bradyrhizobium sp. AUGA SZCCT0160 TaxID=2807662 RepID=UPI001BAA46B7|nr:hypothetical protein [Bradyrhizobium sp. AUGA SZCCT0160]MBR1192517.1 hypothetical protein [Bradyrhizobium sp. AUGA SZCCT0160]
MRRMMTGAGVADFGGNGDAGGNGDVGGADAVGGTTAGTGGIAAAAVWPDEALTSGLWFARKNARAAVHSMKALMIATSSNFLAGFAPAGTAAACDASADRLSSHVTTI